MRTKIEGERKEGERGGGRGPMVWKRIKEGSRKRAEEGGGGVRGFDL